MCAANRASLMSVHGRGTVHIRRVRVHVSNDKDCPQHPPHVNMHKSMPIFGSCDVKIINYIKQLLYYLVIV